MGYDMLFQREVRFFLPAEHVPQAWQALTSDPVLRCGRAKSFEEALWESGCWRATTDACGNVTHLHYEGGSIWDDTVRTLEVIAPYVRPGSYIVLEGEDGCIWRWYFDGEKVIEQEGQIVFEPIHLDRAVVIRPRPPDAGGGWVAEVPDLPGCSVHGRSLAEALMRIDDRRRELLQGSMPKVCSGPAEAEPRGVRP